MAEEGTPGAAAAPADAAAGEQSEATGAVPPLPPPPEIGGEGDDGDWLDAETVRKVADLGFAVLGVAASGVAGFVVSNRRQLKARLSEKLEELAGLKRPASVAPNETVNYVLLLGIGGSGKTTLAQRLTNDHRADPATATDAWQVYSTSRDRPADANEPDRDRCRFYVSDYVGQNLGSLIGAFLDQQQQPNSPLRYGCVTSVILVVDLFSPPVHADEADNEQRKEWEPERVAENDAAWNDQALDAVWGLLKRPSFRHVCLFINKADRLEQQGEVIEAAIRDAYSPLRSRLDQRIRGVRFETIVGSASHGAGVPDLIDDLLERSIRPPEVEV